MTRKNRSNLSDKSIFQRKDEHLRIMTEKDVVHLRGTLLDNIHLLHQALPELNLEDVDLSVEFFGKQLKAPLMITSMTGGTESAFLVKDNRLMTPATGTVLKSITRMSILEAAKTVGIDCFEGQLKPELLFEAEEIFLSCTPFKVLPVRQINDRKMENAPGPLTRKIADLLDDIGSGNDDRFKDWLYPV